MSRPTIRLACHHCDRSDCDGITRTQLVEAKANGWRDVTRFQSFAESCKVWEPTPGPDYHDQLPPESHSAFEWYTHLGTCPDCQSERGEA
jgi:hypothetical protein